MTQHKSGRTNLNMHIIVINYLAHQILYFNLASGKKYRIFAQDIFCKIDDLVITNYTLIRMEEEYIKKTK